MVCFEVFVEARADGHCLKSLVAVVLNGVRCEFIGVVIKVGQQRVAGQFADSRVW
jgi:hypothetical protein